MGIRRVTDSLIYWRENELANPDPKRRSHKTMTLRRKNKPAAMGTALLILLASISCSANANDRDERRSRGAQQGNAAQEQRRDEAARVQEEANSNSKATLDEIRAIRRERAKSRRIERGEADPRF